MFHRVVRFFCVSLVILPPPLLYNFKFGSSICTCCFDFQEVHRMLGGRTLAEFVELTDNKRRAFYTRYLVTEKVVQIEKGMMRSFFSFELSRGEVLRQEYFVGTDSTGQQIAREKKEI